MKHLTPAILFSSATRTGVTLTEVLMSLMIMSLGVSAVAVLFPISVLRSVQATQLTNSAILKYNAEALIQLNPELVFDPDGPLGLSLQQHTQNPRKRYLVDPLGFATSLQETSGNRTIANQFGVAATYTTKPGFSNPYLGYGPPLVRFGGDLESSPLLTGLPGGEPARSEALRALNLIASKTARLGDSWKAVLDTFAVSVHGSGGGVYLDDSVDMADFGYVPSSDPTVGMPPIPVTSPQVPDSESFRIVVFSVDGKFSQSFPLTGIKDLGVGSSPRWLASWSEDLALDGSVVLDLNRNGSNDFRTLPLEFGGFAGRVLIETNQGHDYSWILTVRRTPDGNINGIDVVSRFSQRSEPTDEIAFLATFVAGSNLIGVVYPDNAEPFLKKGGFVFDATNARWYRIQDYVDSNTGTPYDAVITTVETIGEGAGEDQLLRDFATPPNSLALNGQLDDVQVFDALGNPVLDPAGNPVFRNEDLSFSGVRTGELEFGMAVFLPGVVDVYPMGSLTLPDNL